MFIVNVEGAIRKDDRWIIIERSMKEEHAGGGLSLVGGKVEAENTPNILEKTLKREIAEEIGITIKDEMKYIHSITFTTDQGVIVVDVIFLCEYESGTLEVKDYDEVESIYLMTTEEIINHPKTPDYVKGYIQMAEKALSGV